MNADLHTWLGEQRLRVDAALDRFLPPAGTPPGSIHEAMRYSVMAGGKRIRPILAIAAADAVGSDADELMRPFAALELIHTYSLIHDDLPALDDDDLRRGRPTSHKVFGEALAILAGDALLTEAFAWLSDPLPVEPRRQLEAVRLVAAAIDSRGMIGGQVADLEAERSAEKAISREALAQQLDFIHRNKTGQLLTASVVLGGLLAGASEAQIALLRQFGEATGLAFQIVDDLLDLEESAEVLGKTAGKDREQGKLTWPSLHGAEEARRRVAQLVDAARQSADMISGRPNYLGAIAGYLCERRS